MPSLTPQVPLTTSCLSPQPHSRVASRESRISLPDEALCYYENYSDSPLSSPHANATSEGWAQSQPHSQLQDANGDHALSQIPEEGPWNWLEGLRLEFLTATGPALGDVPTGWSTAKVDCLCFSGWPPLAGTAASTRDRSFSSSHWRSFSAVKFLVGEMSGF